VTARPADEALIRTVVACYRWCLVLYPRPFQQAYGTSMLQLFRDRCREARRVRGVVALVGGWVAATLDLIATAAIERAAAGRAVREPSPSATTFAQRVRLGDAVTHDLRVAARGLVRQPVFTAVVVATLALGIGATTTIFSVVHGVLMRPLPYRDSSRLVTLMQWNQPKKLDERPSPANFLDWREASRLVELAAAEPYGMDLTGAGDPITLDTWRVTEGFFDTLGVPPLLGRVFDRSEHVAGNERVVMISHRLWGTRFGADAGIVGRSITLDGQPHVVVGVLPALLKYPADKDIWVPKVIGDRERRARASTYWQVIGRLKPGVSVDRARAELATIGERLAVAYPRSNKGVGIRVIPLFERVTGSVRPALLLLLAGVGCLMLVACANAAHLMLTRAAARREETAVREALGASRWDLLRLALAESTWLALAAGAFGVVISYWAVTGIVALAPADVPRLDEVGLDGRVLLFTVALGVATAMICGLAPSVHLRATTDRTMRAYGRAARGQRFGAILVVAQTALAVVLLAASGLLMRSFGALLKVDLGYRVDNRVALTLHAWERYPQPERRAWFIEEVEARMARQPGVLMVGAASTLPLSQEGSEMDPPYTVVGQPTPSPGDEPTALVTFITPRYFEAIGMRLVAGRALNDGDTATSPPVIVVNEAMARQAWPGEPAVGKRIASTLSFAGNATREVVGVVGDVHQTGLDDRPPPAYYVPIRQVPFGSMTFVARTSGDPAVAVPTLQRAVWSIDPAMSFAGLETMNALLRETLAARRFTLTLLSAFSAVAVALAAVGLYGLVAFWVGRRTTEIGIRMALGAGVRSVLGLVMRQGMTIAGAGVLGGLAAAVVLTRYLRAMLFGIASVDPVTFITLAAVMVLVSAIACYIPARRAAHADPLTAIRTE